MEKANFLEEIKERIEIAIQSSELGEKAIYRNYSYTIYCKKCNEKHSIKISTLGDPKNIKFDY